MPGALSVMSTFLSKYSFKHAVALMCHLTVVPSQVWANSLLWTMPLSPTNEGFNNSENNFCWCKCSMCNTSWYLQSTDPLSTQHEFISHFLTQYFLSIRELWRTALVIIHCGELTKWVIIIFRRLTEFVCDFGSMRSLSIEGGQSHSSSLLLPVLR